MKRSYLILAILSTIPAVFILSFVWEYSLEPIAVDRLQIGDEAESDEERMEFVLSATAFSSLALLPALFLLLRLQRRWQAAQEALQSAKVEAERANRAKSMFLANVSHELRTPLNAVIGFSDTLRTGIFGTIDNPRHADYIEHIHGSGQHLLAMVNDILDLASAEEGKLVIATAEVDLNSVASDGYNTLINSADNSSARVSINLSPSPLIVQGDYRRLLQIVLNLVSNAIKFTPEDGQISVETAMENGTHATLCITDTGPGMDAETLEQALQPFEHTVHQTTETGQGTGLGLPLAVKLAETMGGTLQLDCQPNHGTKAIVSFPLSVGTPL